MGRFAKLAARDTQKQVSQSVPCVPTTGKPQKSDIFYGGKSGTLVKIEVSQGVPDYAGGIESGTPETPAVPPNAEKMSQLLINDNNTLQVGGTLGTLGTPIFDNTVERVSDIAESARQGAEVYATAEPDFGERVALIDRPDLPPEWAEGFAIINTMPKPAAYDLARWYRVIDDGGRFLDQWGAEAARFGWDADSVFGVGSDAPEARHDLTGLIAALNGAEVVDIAADCSRVRMPGGILQTYYRRPAQSGQAMLWELDR